MSGSEIPNSLSERIRRSLSGYRTPSEIVQSVRTDYPRDPERMVVSLAEAAFRLAEQQRNLRADVSGAQSQKSRLLKNADSIVNEYSEAIARVGEAMNTVIGEVPSKTMRLEIRNDIKRLITDLEGGEELFKDMGIKSTRRRPANPHFMLSSPTLEPTTIPDANTSVRKEEFSGITIWTFSASSAGEGVSTSQDAVSYSFNSWGRKSDIPMGSISMADGVSSAALSGVWARLVAFESSNVIQYPYKVTDDNLSQARKDWLQSIRVKMVKSLKENPPITDLSLRNYLNRKQRNRVDKQIDGRRPLDSACTLMTLRFDGRKEVKWASVGDSYLFHSKASLPQSFDPIFRLQRTDTPEVISIANPNPPRPQSNRLTLEMGDLLIMSTDQMGEYLQSRAQSDAYKTVLGLIRQPTNEASQTAWESLCDEIWDSTTEPKDDLTLVVVSFSPQSTLDNGKCYISNYLEEREGTNNSQTIALLDNASIDTQIEFKTRSGTEILHIQPYPDGERCIVGGFGRYYRLSDGRGVKVYTRHEINKFRAPMTNQFLLMESFTEPHGALRKWNGTDALPMIDFIEEINGQRVIAMLMEHIEGHRLQTHVYDDEFREAPDDEFWPNVNSKLLDELMKLQSLGISHGDLCAGNIMITEDDDVRFVDLDAMYSSNLLTIDERGKAGYNPYYQWRNGVDIVPFLVITLAMRMLGADFSTFKTMGEQNDESMLLSTEDLSLLIRTGIDKLILHQDEGTLKDPEGKPTQLSRDIDYIVSEAREDSSVKKLLNILRLQKFANDWKPLLADLQKIINSR